MTAGALPASPTHWDGPGSWENIVSQNFRLVYGIALKLTGNTPDAEDLTHDTFIRAFKGIANYHPQNFEGWLRRITTNLFLDRMRRRQKIRMDSLSDAVADRLHSNESLPETVLGDTNFEADIDRALADLGPEFRAVVELRDIQQLSYEQVSQVLGIKLGTVQSRLHRARKHLRAALAHREPAQRASGHGVVST